MEATLIASTGAVPGPVLKAMLLGFCGGIDCGVGWSIG